MGPGSLQSEVAISHVSVGPKPCGDHILKLSQDISVVVWAVRMHVPQVHFPAKAYRDERHAQTYVILSTADNVYVLKCSREGHNRVKVPLGGAISGKGPARACRHRVASRYTCRMLPG